MSEENKVTTERKDMDILNKMKNLPGGLVTVSYTHLTLPTICSV